MSSQQRHQASLVTAKTGRKGTERFSVSKEQSGNDKQKQNSGARARACVCACVCARVRSRVNTGSLMSMNNTEICFRLHTNNVNIAKFPFI